MISFGNAHQHSQLTSTCGMFITIIHAFRYRYHPYICGMEWVRRKKGIVRWLLLLLLVCTANTWRHEKHNILPYTRHRNKVAKKKPNAKRKWVDWKSYVNSHLYCCDWKNRCVAWVWIASATTTALNRYVRADCNCFSNYMRRRNRVLRTRPINSPWIHVKSLYFQLYSTQFVD